MKNKVKILVCGKEFNIFTEEQPNYIYSLARTLDTRITELMTASNGVSAFTASIMVGLSAMDNLEKANLQMDDLREQSKEYVDEVGKMRLERDAALKQVDQLQDRIAQLEKELQDKQ